MRPFPALNVVITLFALSGVVSADDAGPQFFESRIRPLLADQCFSCHSAQAKKLKANLHLDSRDGALKGGDTGPALIPGHPEKSLLIEAVHYKNPDLQMPPKAKLTDPQIADLTTWIQMGAPWGKDSTTTAVAKIDPFDLSKRKANHWAWHPVTNPPAPPVKATAWPRDPIDQFLLAKLESKKLTPAPDADRRTLLRRLYFDLIGLPPKPEETEAFLNDSSPDAFAKVVDRLLASPQFGERWARHWLDLVRYAETMGHEFDFPIANAWRYRDYVIRALNADVRYDQFVSEQIAGDLLEKPRRQPSGDNESVIGTAFWFFGEDVQAPVDVRQHQADLIDNRIDVLGKSILGLTIACARCHDHKFDAISTADYYALYAFAKGARYTQAAVNQSAIDKKANELRALKQKLRTTIADEWLKDLDPAATITTSAPAALTPGDGDTDLLAQHESDWRLEGAAFQQAQPGDVLLGDATKPLASILTTPSFHSALLSPRLEGTLRSPAFTINQRYLHVRAAGKNARLNVVLENFVVIRDPIYGSLKHLLKSDKPTWITIDLNMWQGRQAYIEFADTSVNDPGTTTGAPSGAGAADGWASVDHAILSTNPKPPSAAESKPQTVDLRTTIESWRDDKITPDAAAALARALEQGTLKTGAESIAPLIQQYRDLERTLPAPTYTPAAADADHGDEKIFIRGNPKTLGPTIPRRFLEALNDHSPLSTQDSELRTTSGRLDLAHRITAPSNPFTSRVIVNRVWHHLFGKGLVGSVDNFGALGEQPTNPDLLDHLATDFIQHDWSLKHLIRTIVLTRAYQMSSRSTADADTADPTNTLLHRANLRRLESETIRDTLLAISTRLDSTMYGPGVPVHLTPFMEGRGRPSTSGPLDGAGRRSIYLEVRRNFLPPMLLAFDTPTPFSTMGRRSISNVPAQALILLNDPFVHQQAKLWATKTLEDKSLATPEQRLRQMYQSAFTRPPTNEELQTLLTYLTTNSSTDEQPLWTDLAHTLINTKEFIFLN